MRKPSTLAAVINTVSDEDLAGLSRDDLIILAEGLLTEPRHPDVDAALRRLAGIMEDVSAPAQRQYGRRRRLLH